MSQTPGLPGYRVLSRVLTLLLLLGLSSMLAGGCAVGRHQESGSSLVGGGVAGVPPPPPSLGGLGSPDSPAGRARYHPGRLLLKMRPVGPGRSVEPASSLATRLSRQTGVELAVRRRFPALDLWLLDLSSGQSVAGAVEALSALPEVDYAEPDYCLQLEEYTPSDPDFWRQWGLKNTAQFTGAVAGSDIEATLAWDLSLGDPSVVVAVIDTGIDYAHPDLAVNMWRNPREIAGNGLDDDSNGYVDDVFGINGYASNGDPLDSHGHGTHCAGIIAAASDGKGVVGVAPRARIMALKADYVDQDGQTVLSEAAIVACLDYAVAQGATILSNSYGMYDEEPLAVRDAFNRARGAGLLVVAAAGNGGTDSLGDDTDAVPHYPSCWAASMDNLVSVGATDYADLPARFSNFGATSVNLFAPGSTIYSTLPNSKWGYKSGTSMAAPLVAGAAALLYACRPGLAASRYRDLLTGSTEPLASLAGKCTSGGRLNAWRALNSRPSPSPSPTPSPSPSPDPGLPRSGTLSLQPGWNLVGLPVARVDSLAVGEGVSTTVYAYDPTSSTYAQVQASPESINAGQGTARGFWVFSAQASTLHYAGLGPAPRDLPLAAGWNLVASPAFRVGDSGVTANGGSMMALAESVCAAWPPPAGCLAHRQAFLYDPITATYQNSDLAVASTQVPEALGFWLYVHAPLTFHMQTSNPEARQDASAARDSRWEGVRADFPETRSRRTRT